jgi:hypothetical protein
MNRNDVGLSTYEQPSVEYSHDRFANDFVWMFSAGPTQCPLSAEIPREPVAPFASDAQAKNAFW